MNPSVTRFLFEFHALSRVFLVLMGATCVAGLAAAAIRQLALRQATERAAAEYRDATKPWNTRLDPKAFLTLRAGNSSIDRLVEVIPGLLVTLGILGTFIGLGIAVSDASRAMSDPQQAMEGLRSLLSTVSFKFQTSAWGILLSIFFTLAVKVPHDRLVERHLEHVATELIGHYKTLGNLANELRDALQTAVSTSLAPLSASLTQQLAALTAPITQFSAGIGEFQRNLATQTGALAASVQPIGPAVAQLQSAAAGLGALSGKIDASLERVSRTLAENLEKGREEQKAALQAQEERLARKLDEIGTRLQSAADANSGALNTNLNAMKAELKTARENQATESKAQTQALQTSITQFREALAAASDRSSQALNTNLNAMKAELKTAHENQTSESKAQTAALQSSMTRFGDALAAASAANNKVLTDNLTAMKSELAKASKAQTDVADAMKRDLTAQLQGVSTAVSNLNTQVTGALRQSNLVQSEMTGLTKHLAQILANFQTHFDHLLKLVEKLGVQQAEKDMEALATRLPGAPGQPPLAARPPAQAPLAARTPAAAPVSPPRPLAKPPAGGDPNL